MRLTLVLAAALIAAPALAQQTVSATPAHENAYGVTTGSPLSTTSPGVTSGSAMSTARLPKPGAADMRRSARRHSGPSPAVGGMVDRSAPMNITQAPR